MKKQGLATTAGVALKLITDYQVEIDPSGCRHYLKMAIDLYRMAHERMPDRIFSLKRRLGLEALDYYT